MMTETYTIRKGKLLNCFEMFARLEAVGRSYFPVVITVCILRFPLKILCFYYDICLSHRLNVETLMLLCNV